jgi:lipoprotein-releasing system permease protein
MFSPLERMIALRYLRAKRREGFISVIAVFSFIGIMLGVATLIVVMAVMNGFRGEITQKILGMNGHIALSSWGGKMEQYDDIVKTIKEVPDVTSAVPVISSQVMLSSDVATVGAVVQGIKLSDLAEKHIVSDHIRAGNISDAKDGEHIIMGTHLAVSLGVTVGNTIKLLTAAGNTTVLGTMPRIKTYTIAALFETGMYEYDNGMLFMPLEAAQLFFRYPDSVSSIVVMTTHADNSQVTSGKIIEATGGQYQVQDWQVLNASLFHALKVERTVMFLILTLIVCIAAFNIVSSLIMLVNDKRKEIAILRTMGATKGMILRIFFMCGAMVGLSGTLAGFILGVGFAANIEHIRRWIESLTGSQLFDPVLYFLSELPSEIQVPDLVMSVGMGVVLSFIATIYPAFKASRQEPVEVLRYE